MSQHSNSEFESASNIRYKIEHDINFFELHSSNNFLLEQIKYVLSVNQKLLTTA
jgi:hypothetical protein